MSILFRTVAVGGIVLASMASPVFADGNEAGLNMQAESLTQNTLKAFAYDWYSRFDRGATMDELLPNLPESEVEFIYPQITLSSIDELTAYSAGAFANTAASAHELDEVFVHPTGLENVYDVITPHTYHIERADGVFAALDFVGRMRVQLGL